MRFLSIDTCDKQLSVAALGKKAVFRTLPDCEMKHSVQLMDELFLILEEAGMEIWDCDFFGCTVGPGSFTGIRIGIATVKGMCVGVGRPALSVTSFDCLAYAEKSGKKLLALVDAGHDNYYACGYEQKKVILPGKYMPREEAEALIAAGYAPVSGKKLAIETEIVSSAEGLFLASEALSSRAASCISLSAVYLRKSSAEEKR